MLIWVPTPEVAAALDGLRRPEVGAPQAGEPEVEVVVPDAAALPPRAPEVEFYVPPMFPAQPAIDAIAGMPGLEVVQTLTAGIDRLLPQMRPGITLCNARGAHDASTAEWVVAATLAAVREFPLFAREQAAGRWSYQYTGCLAGQTVLIIGYGAIGAAVESRLSGFEVDVIRVARGARDGVHPMERIGDLLPAADVVVLLAPVTRETIGMVDAAFLARMRDGALLVNAARGSLVVTADLCAELRRDRLRAVLDVTDPEPLPPGHELWSLPGAFFTPHVAASTPVSAERAIALVAEQAARWLRGEALRNVVSGSY